MGGWVIKALGHCLVEVNKGCNASVCWGWAEEWEGSHKPGSEPNRVWQVSERKF